MVLFLKVAVTAAGAVLAGISTDLQFVQSTASSWKTCPAAAVGRTSRYTFQRIPSDLSFPKFVFTNLILTVKTD